MASRTDFEESESGGGTGSESEDARGRGGLLLILVGESKTETGFVPVARSSTVWKESCSMEEEGLRQPGTECCLGRGLCV